MKRISQNLIAIFLMSFLLIQVFSLFGVSNSCFAENSCIASECSPTDRASDSDEGEDFSSELECAILSHNKLIYFIPTSRRYSLEQAHLETSCLSNPHKPPIPNIFNYC